MLDDLPGTALLELAATSTSPMAPGGGACLDNDGKIQNGCFAVAYIVYMLLNGFVSMRQSENSPCLFLAPQTRNARTCAT